MYAKNNKGLTLIEVLVSISIVSLISLLVSGFFANSASHHSRIEKDYSTSQLCESLLQVYKEKPFSELEQIRSPKTVQLSEELNLPVDDSFYTATVTVSKYPVSLLEDRMLIIQVSVSNQKNPKPFTLEGLVKK